MSDVVLISLVWHWSSKLEHWSWTSNVDTAFLLTRITTSTLSLSISNPDNNQHLTQHEQTPSAVVEH